MKLHSQAFPLTSASDPLNSCRQPNWELGLFLIDGKSPPIKCHATSPISPAMTYFSCPGEALLFNSTPISKNKWMQKTKGWACFVPPFYAFFV
jgi:hypothetical protein